MYELWSTSSGNLIGSYATEEEALDVVLSAIESYGDSYVEDVVLGQEEDQGLGNRVHSFYLGKPEMIAAGQQLADLARSRIYR